MPGFSEVAVHPSLGAELTAPLTQPYGGSEAIMQALQGAHTLQPMRRVLKGGGGGAGGNTGEVMGGDGDLQLSLDSGSFCNPNRNRCRVSTAALY